MSRNIYLDSTQRLRLHRQETQSALMKRHNEKTMKYRLHFIKQQCILTVTFKQNYLTGKSVLILVTNEELVLFCSKKQIGISLQTRTCIHVQVSFVLQYQTTLRKIEVYEVKIPFCFSDYWL